MLYLTPCTRCVIALAIFSFRSRFSFHSQSLCFYSISASALFFALNFIKKGNSACASTDVELPFKLPKHRLDLSFRSLVLYERNTAWVNSVYAPPENLLRRVLCAP